MLRYAVLAFLWSLMLAGLAMIAFIGKVFGLKAMWLASLATFLLALYVERRSPVYCDDDWLPGDGTPRLPPPGTRPLPPPSTRALPPTVRSGTGRKALPPR